MLPTKGGHFITEDPYNFDTAFFKVSAIEASSLDPKQRMLLEVAYEAFENAGLPLQKVAGTQTACYMGTSPSDYRDAIVRDFENWPRLYLIGANDEMISNRLSHFYDLHGPSVTVETACSSSLVAIHQACQSLRSGEATVCITKEPCKHVGRDFDYEAPPASPIVCHDLLADRFLLVTDGHRRRREFNPHTRGHYGTPQLVSDQPRRPLALF